MASAEDSRRSYDLAEQAWNRGDMKLAFRLFLVAAKGGVKRAYGSVGQFYDFGQGTKRSLDDALYWYRRASRESRDNLAANNAGCILRDRNEIAKALWWFRRAVKLGDPGAHLNIARIYLRSPDGVTRAVRHLRMLLRARKVSEYEREEGTRLLRRATAKPSAGRKRTIVATLSRRKSKRGSGGR